MKSERKPKTMTHEAPSTQPKLSADPTLQGVENRFDTTTAEAVREIVAEIEASQYPPSAWTAGASNEMEKRRLLSAIHQRLATATLEIIESGDTLDLRPTFGDRLLPAQRADRLLNSIDLDGDQRPDFGKLRYLCIAMYQLAEIDVNAKSECADVSKMSGNTESYALTLFRLDAAVRQMRFAAAVALACDQ